MSLKYSACNSRHSYIDTEIRLLVVVPIENNFGRLKTCRKIRKRTDLICKKASNVLYLMRI